MSEHPPRRWYQFNLSTILVLVGILAWAMAYWPWGEWEAKSTFLVDNAPGFGGSIFLRDGRFSGTIYGVHASTRMLHWMEFAIPYQIAYPLLALAAFLAWKLGWAITGRRKRRREAVPLS